MADCSLHCGDCLEILPTISSKVDAIVTDLPYGTTNCKWDTALPLHLLWPKLNRLCSGPVVLFAQPPFDKILGASNIQNLKYEWIWEKSHATGHLNAKKMPLKSHENILVFYSKPPTFNPQMTHGHPRKTATKRGDRSQIYGKQSSSDITYDSTSRYPRSVLRFASDKQRECLHPTQKPLDLIRYLVATYTNAGDTVLDCCMGSGTTGKACVELGRKFVGIEKDAGYFEVASRRIHGNVAPVMEGLNG